MDEEEMDDWCDILTCSTCSGKGIVLVCVDDVCRGRGECIHGDGMGFCPDCGGDGWIERRWPEVKAGNIFQEDADALVNPVNCVGIMGRGLALQFRRRFPWNFEAYADTCALGKVRPGEMFVWETGLETPRWIVNFPTKRHWRDRSSLENIELGLKALRQEVMRRGIRSLAVPALGCGLGELRWAEVLPLMTAALSGFWDVRVVILQPKRS